MKVCIVIQPTKLGRLFRPILVEETKTAQDGFGTKVIKEINEFFTTIEEAKMRGSQILILLNATKN